MNVGIFGVAIAAGFVGGVFSVRRVTQAKKLSLLITYGAIATALSLYEPPDINKLVFLTVILFGSAPAIDRYISIIIGRRIFRRKANALLGKYD